MTHDEKQTTAISREAQPSAPRKNSRLRLVAKRKYLVSRRFP